MCNRRIPTSRLRVVLNEMLVLLLFLLVVVCVKSDAVKILTFFAEPAALRVVIRSACDSFDRNYAKHVLFLFINIMSNNIFNEMNWVRFPNMVGSFIECRKCN